MATYVDRVDLASAALAQQDGQLQSTLELSSSSRDWSSLKESLHLEKARSELAECLDHYYNTQRQHSALGYYAPLEVELHYLFNLP